MPNTPPERLADHFINYLYDNYRGSRHVRRVASWIGFIILGLARAGISNLHLSRSRQTVFDYSGRRFKVRYHHQAGGRGGIQIVEVSPGRGAPEGQVVLTITTLLEAEKAYRSIPAKLRRFVAS